MSFIFLFFVVPKANEMMKKITLFIIMCLVTWIAKAQNNVDTLPNDSLTTQLVKMESDKVTYNVQADPEAPFLMVLDILHKVPMVTIDGQDNVQVNGTPMFKVYVNGKPNVMMTNNPAQAFRSMHAANVLTIEVITNPGARYDAEGVSAVLNINTTQASASALKGHSFSGSVHGLMSNVNKEARAFISGQAGKFTYSANILAYEMHAKDIFTTETYTYFTDDVNFNQVTSDLGDKKLHYQQGEISLGYEPDDKSAINASFSYNNTGTRSQGDPITSFTTLDGDYFLGYINYNDFKWAQRNFNVNLNYQRYLDEEHSKYFLFSYILTSAPMIRKERSVFEMLTEVDEEDDLVARFTDAYQNQLDHTLQTDFSTALGEHHRITTGAKYINSRLSSKTDFYIDMDDAYEIFDQLDYRYTNNILAGYAEYEGNFSKVGLKGGLRYEHTWLNVDYKKGEGEDFNKNYGQLVPSASMVVNLSKSQSIGLNYNMRIVRPMIWQLDPYVDRSDPSAIQYGNTYLDVVKNHNLSLVYNLFTPKLSLNLTLQHAFSNNAIESYTFQEDDILFTTYDNIVKTRQTGLSLFANWAMTKTTQVTLNGNVSYNVMKSKEIGAHSKGWTAFATLGIMQELPWQIKLSANLNPCTRTYTLQGWYAGHTLMNASITKGFFNDRLGVTIAVETALGHGGQYTSHSLDIGQGFQSTTYTHFPVQQISIGLTYNFGNKTRPKVQPYSGSSFVNRVEMALWD